MGAMKKLYTAGQIGQAQAPEVKGASALQEWIRYTESPEFHERSEMLRRAERARELREELLMPVF